MSTSASGRWVVPPYQPFRRILHVCNSGTCVSAYFNHCVRHFRRRHQVISVHAGDISSKRGRYRPIERRTGQATAICGGGGQRHFDRPVLPAKSYLSLRHKWRNATQDNARHVRHRALSCMFYTYTCLLYTSDAADE